ncbi:MAG: hypothetical protein RI910_273 [Verrucomicrobiota bacterium]
MRILVTGGAGFIGSHVCALLISRGHEVLAYDQGVAAAPDWLKTARKKHAAAEVIVGDILDVRHLTDVIRSNRPDVLINLAAKPGVAEAEQEPALYHRINVEGVDAILEACLGAGLRQIVHASSSSVYGHSIGPINESQPLSPIGQYGLTKMQGETKIREAARRNGISARILRPFTVIGPFGRPDMAPWKFSEAITRGSPWHGCEIYNIGAGEHHTAAGLAELLAKELGLPLQVEEVGLPPYLPKATWADPSSARRRLGWRPKTTFSAAAREFASWYQLNATHG